MSSFMLLILHIEEVARSVIRLFNVICNLCTSTMFSVLLNPNALTLLVELHEGC